MLLLSLLLILHPQALEIELTTLRCSFGQFSLPGGKCLKCPNPNNDFVISCLECLLFPDSWSSNPLCLTSYTTLDVTVPAATFQPSPTQDLFYIDETIGTVLLCEGCLRYCDEPDLEVCFQSSYFNLSKQKAVQCKPGFYFQEGRCNSCGRKCNLCQENYCAECEPGYQLRWGTCQQCEGLRCDASGQLECPQLPPQILLNGRCILCGHKCDLCYAYQGLPRCLRCKPGFFVTEDGINCSENSISGCEFQYLIASPTEFSVNPLFPLGKNYQPICMKCQTNSYDEKNRVCSTYNLANCDYNIKDQSNNYVCIIGQDSLIQNKNCLEGCQSCVTNYCIACQIGYYSDFNTGVCTPCPPTLNCLKCQQSHSSEYWGIYSYFKRASGGLDLKTYFSALPGLSIKCVQCNAGWELYQGQCILGCPASCAGCVKQNGKNICKSCPTLSRSEGCLSCPNNCIFCMLRPNLLNPYFQSPQFSQYSNACLKPTMAANLYYADQMFFSCPTYGKCYHKVVLEYTVYCDSIQHEIDYFNSPDKPAFEESNKKFSKLNELFLSMETDAYYQQLNEQQISEISIKLKIKQEGALCGLDGEIELTQKFSKNVYLLKDVNLLIVPLSDSMITLENFSIKFIDFSEITFQKIRFATNQNKLVHEQSHNKPQLSNGIMIFDNCQFSSLDQAKAQCLTFGLTYGKRLIIKDSKFIKASFRECTIFPKAEFIEITSLEIHESSFVKTSIFQTINLKATVTMNKVLLRSTFTESTFMSLSTQAELTINEMSVISSIITGPSKLFSSTACCTVLNKIILSASQFISSATLVESTSLQLTSFHIEKGKIQDSLLLIASDSSNSLNTRLTNIVLMNTDITGDGAFISLYQPSSSLELSQIKLLSVDNSKRSKAKARFYIQAIQKLTLSDVVIERNIGSQEFYIANAESVSVQDIRVTQLASFYILANPSFDCLKSFYNQGFYGTLIEIASSRSIVLNDLRIKRINSFNEALIKVVDFKESLTVTKTDFSENIVFVTNQILQTAIILVKTSEHAEIKIDMIRFSKNIFQRFAVVSTLPSSTTLMIDSSNSTMTLSDAQFSTNLALNTTETVLRIGTKKLYMESTTFTNNNQFEYSTYREYLAYSFSFTTGSESIRKMFQSHSLGGSAYLSATSISMSQIRVSESSAGAGGCFYFKMIEQGEITVLDSQFSDTKSNLWFGSTSYGGCLYIDGSQSSLNVLMTSVSISNSFSRKAGGAIYIITSLQQSKLHFEGLSITDCYSISGGIIAAFFQNKNQWLSVNRFTSYYGKEKFVKFFELFEKAESGDSLDFYQKGGLFYIVSGNVKMVNCDFLQGYGFGAFYMTQSFSVQLLNIVFTNYATLYHSLIYMIGQMNDKTSIYIQNIQISNIKDGGIEFNDCLGILYPITEAVLQCKSNSPGPSMVFENMDPVYYEYMSECNQNAIITNHQQYDALIKVYNIWDFVDGKLKIKNVDIRNNRFVRMASRNGFFLIAKLFPGERNFVELSDINFRNNVMGRAFQFLGYGVSSTFARRLQTTFKVLDPVVVRKVSAVNNTYKANFGTNQGELQTIFDDTVIQNNTFVFTQRYSLYQRNPSMWMFNQLITDNIATENFTIPAISVTQNYLPDFELLKCYVQFNKGNQNEAGDISETPVALTLAVDLKLTKFATARRVVDGQVIDLIQVKPYSIPGYGESVEMMMLPTGSSLVDYKFFDEETRLYVPLNQSLRLLPLNRYNQLQETLFQDALINPQCVISQRELDFEKQQLDLETNFTKMLNFTPVVLSDFSIDIGDKLLVIFNPYAAPSKYLQLQIKCTFIRIPVTATSPPFDLLKWNANYELRLNVRTFKCQIGEFFIENRCGQCDPEQNQYSVVPSASVCQLKDDISTLEVKQSSINLKSGFWRYKHTSMIIENCYHLLANCLGGWEPGNPSCALGHSGALCEQCDIYNIRGFGSFSVSSQYKCGSCEDVQYNIVAIVLISLWTVVCTVITVKSNLQDTDGLILTEAMKAFRISPHFQAVATILIKMLTNYFQIIATIFTFQLDIPPEIQVTSNGIGNPAESMLYSLECFIAPMSEANIMYIKVIWLLVTPFFYIFFIYILYLLMVLTKFQKFSISVITTTAIYVYIYLQPNIMQGLISLISKRNISGVDFVQGNVSYEFHTDSHYQWCLTFILPSILIVAFLIPLYLFTRLYYQRDSLDQPKVRIKWGYLYNEYSQFAYYWETVKVVQKQCIIIALNYYEDYIPVKASLVLLIVFIYQMFSNRIRPYKQVYLNSLDTKSTVVCSISIILCSSIYSAQRSKQQEIVWPFYVITALLNVYFILILLFRLLVAQLDQQQDVLDKIKVLIHEKFPNFVNRCQWLQPYLLTRHEQQARVDKRYRALKKYLMKKAREIIRVKYQGGFMNSPLGGKDSGLKDSVYTRKSMYYMASPNNTRQVSQHKNSTNTQKVAVHMQSSYSDLESDLSSPQIQPVYVEHINSRCSRIEGSDGNSRNQQAYNEQLSEINSPKEGNQKQ